MDNNDLANAIENHARLILPDFGAFLLKESNSNTFKVENITFSPFLKYNDNVLEEYYAKYKGIPKDESIKQVKIFVDTIKEKIKSEGEYTIEGVGKLLRDNRGAIIFSPEGHKIKGFDSDTASKQLEEKKKKQSKVKKSSSTDTSQASDIKPIIEIESSNEKEQTIEIDSSLSLDFIETTKSEIQSSPIVSGNNEMVDFDENAKMLESNPNEYTSVTQKEDNQLEPMAKQKKKSKLSVYLLVLGISFTLIIVLAFIIREMVYKADQSNAKVDLPTISNTKETQTSTEELKTVTPKDDIDKAFEEMTTNQDKENSNTEEDNNNVEVSIEKSVIENATIQNKDKDQFYLVVGSFKDKTNASRYAEQLKSEGYNTGVIIQPNGNNSVTVGSFSNKDKAIAEKNRLATKFPNIWISKKNGQKGTN